MVLQQELVDEILVPHVEGLGLSVAWGEDTSVSYNDNAITTTNFTDADPTSTSTNNIVIVDSAMASGEGGTSDYDALLISDTSGNAILKALYTQFTKDSNTRIDVQARIAFYVQ